jgi:hypothetical protein
MTQALSSDRIMRIAVLRSCASALPTFVCVAGRSPAVKQVPIAVCRGARQSPVHLLDGSSATCWEGDQVGTRPPGSNEPEPRWRRVEPREASVSAPTIGSQSHDLVFGPLSHRSPRAPAAPEGQPDSRRSRRFVIASSCPRGEARGSRRRSFAAP